MLDKDFKEIVPQGKKEPFFGMGFGMQHEHFCFVQDI